MQTTEEPKKTTSKLADDFERWWFSYARDATGWDGTGEAPNSMVQMLRVHCWRLYRIAATQEGVIE